MRLSLPAVRRSWPLGLLLVSLALTAIAAINAYRAVASHDATVARAMREFSSFAAWSFGQRLDERIGAMLREALGAVNHGDNLHMSRTVPKARDLAHYLPYDTRCECHRTRLGPQPVGLFAFELGDRALDVAVNTHPDPREGWEVDRPAPAVLPAGASPDYAPADERWILDTITTVVRATPRPWRGFTLVLGRESRRVIGYTLMPTSWGDTLVYGVEYPRAEFAAAIGDVLDSPGLLPETFTASHSNREVVVARVTSARGDTLFDSAPREPSVHAASFETQPHNGTLHVDVFVRPARAGALVVGGVPKSRLPFLLGVLGLGAALSVVAIVLLRREMELARLRSDFVSNVSHELRTPLAQIRLYTDMLRMGRTRTDEQREWSLSHIDRETTRLGMLVENVLRFGRRGVSDVTAPVATDVGAETAKILQEVAPLAASRRVRIASEIGPTPPVPLRPDALRRLLLNLVDNALKYGPEGQTIRVAVERVGDAVQLRVDDEGPGVRDAERDAVWQPFARGSAATVAAGSGIGLSVVRTIVRDHGGRAWIETAPGGGARFVVALPVGRAGNGAS